MCSCSARSVGIPKARLLPWNSCRGPLFPERRSLLGSSKLCRRECEKTIRNAQAIHRAQQIANRLQSPRELGLSSPKVQWNSDSLGSRASGRRSFPNEGQNRGRHPRIPFSGQDGSEEQLRRAAEESLAQHRGAQNSSGQRWRAQDSSE